VTPSLTLVAAGDSVLTAGVAAARDADLLQLAGIIRGADVAFTNLETTLHDFQGTPQIANLPPLLAGDPRLIEDLKSIGFNAYSTANNHIMDWGEGGLLATMETLDRARVQYAGTGRYLQEARAPRYWQAAGGRVALLAATSTFPPHTRAGAQRADCQGRPGVNPLRFETVVDVDRDTMRLLQTAEERVGLNATRENRRRLGFERPFPPGMAVIFDKTFRLGDIPGVHTAPHAGDLEGNLARIRDARRQARWVVVSLHAHEAAGTERERPAEFIPAFCHAAIDAGADVVVGHGPHLVRGVEMYRGKPIFYSLGNFIFQTETVARQPADLYEQLGLPESASPSDLFDAHGARGGFAVDPVYWEGLVATCQLADAEVGDIRLYPVTLGYGRPRPERGTPKLADDAQGRAIIARTAGLSTNCDVAWDPSGYGRVSW
jgi:poly-gamma-glutamate capsule biosynthesis protein CapA/YwtB (metallophosphatase superfamily)